MPRPGSKRYKGPVHETVRKLTGDRLSASKRKPKAKTKTHEQIHAEAMRARKATETLDLSPDARKARMLRARSIHAKRGTSYDPLSSISPPKRTTKKKSKKKRRS